MLTPYALQTHLTTNSSLLPLDGALATYLETRGHNLSHPLWSGLILQTSPASILNLHKTYYLSGAAIAITASYQTSTAGLSQHLRLSEEEGRALIRRSVCLAREAKDEVREALGSGERTMLVAGSVGPYGAFLADGSEYHGRYGEEVSEEGFKTFHRPRIQALSEAGVDLLALETMPCLAEIRALVGLLREEFPTAVAWVSCTLFPGGGGRIADGSALREVLGVVEGCAQIVGVGVNCCEQGLALEALRGVRDLAREMGLVLVCYPNSGEEWDGVEKVWRKGEGATTGLTAQRVEAFVQAGAGLVGGCCRTGPEDIAIVARTLERLRKR